MTREETQQHLIDWIEFVENPNKHAYSDEPCTDEEILESMRIASVALSPLCIPSDLDDAAVWYAETVNYREWDKGPYNFVQTVFKAGAEWMAGQGVTLNLSIDELSCGAYNACVEQGLTSEDDVIIQIRKKQ